MPNGTGLLGNNSSTMSALAVPQPDHPGIYYLFTTDAMENSGAAGFNYDIIDMSAHGGLGDVTSLNNLLFAPCSEVNHAVKHANCIDYWIVAREWFTNTYRAYLLTASGISTPVITSIGLPETFFDAGQGKFSPDGSKYAISNAGSGILQLFDFNTTTGVFSNPITLYHGSVIQTYGLSFSPDNTKLYAANQLINVYQWDVTSGDSTTITASKTFIATPAAPAQFQLGKDHKLYISNSGYNFLSVISNPNLAGLACNYDSAGITLPANCELGLPAFPENYFNTSSPCAIHSYVFARAKGTCYDDSSGQAWVELSNINPPYSISWNPGGMTTDTITGLPSGTYYANVTDSSGIIYTDSVIVKQPSSALSATIFTIPPSVCPGTFVTLSGLGQSGVQPYIYQWITSSGLVKSDTTSHMNSDTTSYTYPPQTSGVISLRVTDLYNCSAISEIPVTTLPLRIPEIKGPLFSCNGTLTTLVVDSASYFTNLLWSNASVNDSISVLSGIYILTATNPNGCKAKDTVQVIDAVPEVFILGVSTLCQGTNITLTADPTFISGANYVWSNTATTQTISVSTGGPYAVHVNYNNGCSAADSVFISSTDAPHANFITSPASTSNALMPVTFTDQSTISSGTITTWYWNFGDRSANNTSGLQNPTHIFANDGTYQILLAVQSNNGCWDTTRFNYVIGSDIIIPNVFTPNHDGKNDYLAFKNLEFFPGSSIEIYNRWGTKVYSNPDYHNDWNGDDQKEGVYYFVLKGNLLKEIKYGFFQIIK